MTESDRWYPVCFSGYNEYKEWRYMQRGADEVSCACDDCSSDYMLKMIEQNRCFPVEVKKRTSNSKKKDKHENRL